ncbi:MAG TPA: molecular chaperone HtpG [Gudongella oleilytica]|nr:molecular chaperone HtpG [Gudongella oleilytica]
MEKKQFQAESKRLLDLMINSIYTHKEIFLRELISNASDAIDKIYYKALTDDSIQFNKDDYFIKIETDDENRTLKIIDTGIGMTKEELEDNLGTIAKSGSLQFKKDVELKDGYDIIGQFGVGFYSAFMVADKVEVVSKAFGEKEAWRWVSEGAEGYIIEPSERDQIGTEITLTLKKSSEDEDYDQYLDEYTLKGIVKKYSDFIRYPIRMEISEYKKNEETDKYETVKEEKTINSMIPIWRKSRKELKDEDYENFYSEKHFGFDKPIKWTHISIDGAVRYDAILYIPEKAPYDYYTREYEKGLELYSSGVLIMNKCPELLPDYFSFVKGVVDSEDLSLNISREMLQHDRQLKLMAKKIEEKIKDELASMLKNEREKYIEFFKTFGKQLKFGIYSDFGMNREKLEDLLMFQSSKDKELVTLAEYVDRMPEEQPFIYYAAGDSVSRLEKLPQTELLRDKGYEILYFTDEVDEFAIRMIPQYKEKEFRNVSGSDLGLKEQEKEVVEDNEKELFEKMKDILGDKVKSVRPSNRLKSHPVCFASEGEISIEMEKILSTMPNSEGVHADKVLELNQSHPIFGKLKSAEKDDPERFTLYTELLYDQARLIEGLPLEDPVEFANRVAKLM